MAEYSFKLQKGTDRTLIFAFYEKDDDGEKVVYDFTGFTGAMQIRTTYSSQKAVDSFTTSNGKMEIDVATGRVSIKFDHQSTEQYPVGSCVMLTGRQLRTKAITSK